VESFTTCRKFAEEPQGLYMKMTLPIPPSVNHMYRSKRGGVYKSKKYQQWIQEAALMIQLTRKGAKINPPYKFIMTIVGGKGWRTNRDLDNCLKPVLDLLTTMNIIEDDNCHLVNSLAVIFVAGNGSDAKCMVELLENH